MNKWKGTTSDRWKGIQVTTDVEVHNWRQVEGYITKVKLFTPHLVPAPSGNV